MLKGLNLGCGNIPYRSTDEIEWTNVELYYVPGHPLCSWDDSFIYLQADMRDIAQYYAEGEFDIVHCVHALEHVSSDAAMMTLDGIAKVLKPGGILELETPDLDKACRLWLEGQQDSRILGLFYGTSGADGDGQFHLTGFNYNRFENELMARGFHSIEEIEVGAGHGKPEPEYDIRIRAYR
jgi:SAM-dependent methyltransferase